MYGSLVDNEAKNLINEADRAMPGSSFVASVTTFFIERGFISASQAEALRKSIGDANAYRQDVAARQRKLQELYDETQSLLNRKNALLDQIRLHNDNLKAHEQELEKIEVQRMAANDALHALLIDTKLVKEARIEADAEGADISRMHCPFCGRLILFVINKSPKKRSKTKVVSTKKAQAKPYTGKCECGAPYRLDSDYLIRFDYRTRYLEDESQTADFEIRTRKLELD